MRRTGHDDDVQRQWNNGSAVRCSSGTNDKRVACGSMLPVKPRNVR